MPYDKKMPAAADVFGGGRKAPAGDDEPDADGDTPDDTGEPSPEFQAAYKEWVNEEDPDKAMRAMYRTIEACKAEPDKAG